MADGDLWISGDTIGRDRMNLKTPFVGTTTAPATTFAGQTWIDTSTGLIRLRNGANSQWEMVQRSYLDNNPNGFPVNTSGNPNPSDQSTLTFVNATRTLHLAPTGANYKAYIHGIEYTFTTDQTVQITATEGLWYIYFNSSGVLTASQSIWDLEQVASVALVYWDNTNSVCNYFADERHLLTMDWRTHQYLHNTVGCRYASGLVISGYTLNTDSDAAVEIGLTAGSLYDEDLQFTPTNGTSGTPASTPSFYNQPLTKPATIPVYYQVGANNVWRKTTVTNFYMLNNAGGSTHRLQYNLNTAGTWSLAELGNLDYVSIWIFGTNDIDNPILAILGQQDNTTLANAVANDTFAALSIASGLPFLEMKLLYQIILKSSTTYSGTTKSRVSQVNDFRNVNNINTSIIVPSAQYISSVDSGYFTVTAGQITFSGSHAQAVGSGDSPTFVSLTLTGFVITEAGSVDYFEMIYPLHFTSVGAGSTYMTLDTSGNLVVTGGITMVTSTTGVLKAASGVISGSASMDDIADGSTYVRSHNDFSATYKGYLNQAVTNVSSPTFVGLTLTGVLTGTGWVNSAPSTASANPWFCTPTTTRALNTVYHNATGKDVMVYVDAYTAGNAVANVNYVYVNIGSTSSPNIRIGIYGNSTLQQDWTFCFKVPNGWYYEVFSVGSVTFYTCTEQYF